MTRAPWPLPVWLIAGGYAALYSALGVIRYRAYLATCDDGLFTQTIASAFHGFSNTAEGGSHFAYHFSPVLYLFAPAIWIWKSAIVLIVAQAVAGALIVPPIYAIARRRMPHEFALGVAAVAALYPPLGGVVFGDFSENALAPAAAAWLLWAIDRRSMVLAALFAALCLTIKEDQTVMMSALGAGGAWYFAVRGERKWAIYSLALLAVSVATMALFLTVVRKLSGAWFAYPYISDFYDSSAHALVAGFFAAPKLTYLYELLLPLLGICLLSRCMLLALPGLVECLGSRIPIVYMQGTHYAAAWIPYVLVAFALGVARLWRRSPRLAGAALILCALLTVYTNVFASPNRWSDNLAARAPQDAELDRIVATLPQQRSITGFCRVYAHLGMHPHATVYAESATQNVILYPAGDDPAWEARERRFIARSGGYRLVREKAGIELYELAIGWPHRP